MMSQKFVVIALAVLAFGFGSALRSNAGTEVIDRYSAPAATYNYAPPPPRPVYYAPPPPVPVNVLIYPAYGYYGPRFGFYRVHRFDGRPVYWRSRYYSR